MDHQSDVWQQIHCMHEEFKSILTLPSPVMKRDLQRPSRPPHVALLVETSLASGRDILRGIARYVRERSFWSLYHEPRSLEDAVPRWFQQWKGDGIIARIQTPAMAKAIRQTGIPTVDVLGVVEGIEFPLVHVDDVAISHRAAEHLLERGFRNHAFFGIEQENWSEQRCEAFRFKLESLGHCVSEYLVPRHEPADASWETQQEELAAWVAALSKPIGVMVCSDQRGVQFLDACRRAGVHVPDEVAVIGVDNDETLCDVSHPPLSSVWPDHARVGFDAAALLESLMRGGKAPTEPLLVPPRDVVTRLSTEVLAVKDRVISTALRLVREQACERIRVDAIAAQVGVSRSILQRRFRSMLGRTVHEELVMQRLKRAQQLLTGTDLPLLDVAERSGFQHQEYMTAVFKSHLGITPARFRKRGKG